MKRFVERYAGILASLALAVTTVVANSTCTFIIHQDELPHAAKKLRKF